MNDSKKEELEVHCHTNEMIGALKKHIAEKLQQSVSDCVFESLACHGVLGSNKDFLLMDSILKNDTDQSADQCSSSSSDTWTVTINSNASSSTSLMVFDDRTDFGSSSSATMEKSKFMFEEQVCVCCMFTSSVSCLLT